MNDKVITDVEELFAKTKLQIKKHGLRKVERITGIDVSILFKFLNGNRYATCIEQIKKVTEIYEKLKKIGKYEK